MRSLKRIFNKIRMENPFWSDYTCFAEAVHGKGFSRKTIIRSFNSLVDKEDYTRSEKKEIIEHLVGLSKSG
jgi:hypothetical protein